MTDSSPKQLPPYGLRIPPELKDRVQDSAKANNRSMHAEIIAALEREFPQPTINLHELAAFLEGVSSEMQEHGDGSKYVEDINRGLSTARTPWCVKAGEMGVVSFYPYADPPPAISKPKAAPSE